MQEGQNELEVVFMVKMRIRIIINYVSEVDDDEVGDEDGDCDDEEEDEDKDEDDEDADAKDYDDGDTKGEQLPKSAVQDQGSNAW